MGELKGMMAVVTGGSSGIGFATAKSIRREGCPLQGTSYFTAAARTKALSDERYSDFLAVIGMAAETVLRGSRILERMDSQRTRWLSWREGMNVGSIMRDTVWRWR